MNDREKLFQNECGIFFELVMLVNGFIQFIYLLALKLKEKHTDIQIR